MDISKYLSTVVVIGGLVAEEIVWKTIVLGLVIAVGVAIVGVWVTPADIEIGESKQ